MRFTGTKVNANELKKLLRAAHLMWSRRGVCKWKISRWIKNKVPKREHENEVGLRDQRGLGSWADTSSISLPANMRGQSVLGLKINRRSRGIIKKQSATKGDLTRAWWEGRVVAFITFCGRKKEKSTPESLCPRIIQSMWVKLKFIIWRKLLYTRRSYWSLFEPNLHL